MTAKKWNSRPRVALAVACTIALATIASAADELAVRISPERAYVRPGGEAVFSAAVRGTDGAPVEADVSWSVIPPRVGTIGPDGRFRAGEETGRAIVRAVAVHGSATGTGHAVVDVGAETPSRLDVAVRPANVVVAAEGSQRFEATVTDPLTGGGVEAEVRWVVVPERLGVIDESGLFTAGGEEGAGRVAARATADGREGVGDAGVVVGSPPGPGVRVNVVPPQALLAPGEELGFDAVVTDQEGGPIEADVSWSVMPTRLGVVDASGSFTAGPDEGVGRVVATVATSEGPARGFARVEVRSAGPAGIRVRIRPREAAVTPGGEVQFEAQVVGPDGEPLAVPVDWAVRPAWIGVIDQDGLFVASDDMPEPSADGVWAGTVIASVETYAGVASDAARVIVREAGPSLRLRIQPHRTVVAPGGDVQFETRVIGAGEPTEWTTEWAVFPGDLGTITPDGLFTANPIFGDPGSSEFGPHEGIVGARATLPDGSILADRAHVRVRNPGQPVRIRVVPAFAVVPPGESMTFEAFVLGPDGGEIELPVSWFVHPEHLGLIDADGVFTAADVTVDPGSWQRPRGTVVAEVRLPGGQIFRGVAVVVIDLADPEITVRISPKSVTLEEGDSFQFEAEAFDGDGTPVAIDFEWRVSDSVLGTVDGSGLFTAAASVPAGHTRRTAVTVGGLYHGRLYWDFATVRVMEN